MLKHSSIVAAVGGFFDFIGNFGVQTSASFQEMCVSMDPPD